MSNNPYQAPSTYADAPTAELVEEIKPLNVGAVLFKWLVICAVSAGPSFFWGVMIGRQQLNAAIGMILGVLTFAAVYTVFECRPFVQRLLRNRLIKRTAKIGYGTRIAISIIFPVGLYLDMIVGFGAMMTVEALVSKANPLDGGGGGPPASVSWFFITTLFQGFYLNIVLFVYMLCVYVLVQLFSRPAV